MRKIILSTIVMLFFTIAIFSQPISFDISKFRVINTYPIERVYFYSNNEIEGNNVISCGEGYYMIKVENIPDFKVKFNGKGNKAIIDGMFYPIIFDVEENNNRITFYSKKPYFGFIYDKRYKVLCSFTSKKYHRKIKRHSKKW